MTFALITLVIFCAPVMLCEAERPILCTGLCSFVCLCVCLSMQKLKTADQYRPNWCNVVYVVYYGKPYKWIVFGDIWTWLLTLKAFLVFRPDTPIVYSMESGCLEPTGFAAVCSCTTFRINRYAFRYLSRLFGCRHLRAKLAKKIS